VSSPGRRQQRRRCSRPSSGSNAGPRLRSRPRARACGTDRLRSWARVDQCQGGGATTRVAISGRRGLARADVRRVAGLPFHRGAERRPRRRCRPTPDPSVGRRGLPGSAQLQLAVVEVLARARRGAPAETTAVAWQERCGWRRVPGRCAARPQAAAIRRAWRPAGCRLRPSSPARPRTTRIADGGHCPLLQLDGGHAAARGRRRSRRPAGADEARRGPRCRARWPRGRAARRCWTPNGSTTTGMGRHDLEGTAAVPSGVTRTRPVHNFPCWGLHVSAGELGVVG